ncbi:MAG: CoA transferase subunit A [Chloroflexi bacterium]|nr:MAG: CoA transferase subunit A [Chloroflexota bacterium]
MKNTKVVTLEEAISAIPDGAVVALSGNTLHRSPGAAVHEIIRQGKQGLELVKTAGAYDVDVLCGAGCVAAVSAGFVGFENVFGLAPRYRKAVESGAVEVREHACYSVIAGLRAAIQGVPFMPVRGMTGSDVLAARDFRTVTDPYSGESVVAIPRLQPDVAIIHVQEATVNGDARIFGSRFEDVLMAKASQHVIITCEQLVDPGLLEQQPELTTIAGFFVDAVVEIPGGAWPNSCYGYYDYDHDFLEAYIRAAQADDPIYEMFLRENILNRAPAGVEAGVL